MQHLPLNQLGEAAAQARVAKPAGAVFPGVGHHGDRGVPVGMTTTHQWQGIDLMAAGLECFAQQGAGEVLPVTIAQQQQPCHFRSPASSSPW